MSGAGRAAINQRAAVLWSGGGEWGRKMPERAAGVLRGAPGCLFVWPCGIVVRGGARTINGEVDEEVHTVLYSRGEGRART